MTRRQVAMARMPSGAYTNGTDAPAWQMGLAGMHGLQGAPPRYPSRFRTVTASGCLL